MAISFYILTESEGNNGHKKRKCRRFAGRPAGLGQRENSQPRRVLLPAVSFPFLSFKRKRTVAGKKDRLVKGWEFSYGRPSHAPSKIKGWEKEETKRLINFPFWFPFLFPNPLIFWGHGVWLVGRDNGIGKRRRSQRKNYFPFSFSIPCPFYQHYKSQTGLEAEPVRLSHLSFLVFFQKEKENQRKVGKTRLGLAKSLSSAFFWLSFSF